MSVIYVSIKLKVRIYINIGNSQSVLYYKKDGKLGITFLL